MSKIDTNHTDINQHRSSLEEFKNSEWYQGVENFLNNQVIFDRSSQFEIGGQMMEGAWKAFTQKECIAEESVYFLMGYILAQIICKESICSFSHIPQLLELNPSVRRCANHAINCPCSFFDNDSMIS